MKDRYDLIVIGAGPAGYVGAVEAASLNKSVLVVECREAGGTCLNRGCVPTKTLLHSAELFAEIKSAERLGIAAEKVTVDYDKMTARKDEIVAKLRGGIELLFKQNGIDYVESSATIKNSGAVTVGGEDIRTDKILIATGSVPARIPIEGVELSGVVTSDELLAEKVLPKSIVIIGGGVIGIEFASLFNALGVSVSVIEATERILPLLDVELSRSVSASLKKRGVTFVTSAKVVKIEKSEGLECSYEEKGESKMVSGERVLLSVGRRANIDGLFADGFSLKTERGYIVADESGATSEDSIYAAGDVVFGAVQLAHVASASAVNAVLSMFGDEARYDMRVVPSCVYTCPEIASVGLSEKQAEEKGIRAITGKYLMTANARTLIETDERGFVKVVFDGDSKRIIGAQLMCPRATDMVAELSTAIVSGLTAKDMLRTIKPHPTFAEGIAEAVEDAAKKLCERTPI